jgi:hypothetical protein
VDLFYTESVNGREKNRAGGGERKMKMETVGSRWVPPEPG